MTTAPINPTLYVLHPDGTHSPAPDDVIRAVAATQAPTAAQAVERPGHIGPDGGAPVTSRDRWFYEQGRLAERDPRTASAAQHPQPSTRTVPVAELDAVVRAWEVGNDIAGAMFKARRVIADALSDPTQPSTSEGDVE